MTHQITFHQQPTKIRKVSYFHAWVADQPVRLPVCQCQEIPTFALLITLHHLTHRRHSPIHPSSAVHVYITRHSSFKIQPAYSPRCISFTHTFLSIPFTCTSINILSLSLSQTFSVLLFYFLPFPSPHHHFSTTILPLHLPFFPLPTSIFSLLPLRCKDSLALSFIA